MEYLEFLASLKAHEVDIHVIGRTSYRTATVKNVVSECPRKEISFLEDRLQSQDNHCVMIFQILYGKYSGVYYAFLSDSWCQIGTEIVYEDF